MQVLRQQCSRIEARNMRCQALRLLQNGMVPRQNWTALTLGVGVQEIMPG